MVDQKARLLPECFAMPTRTRNAADSNEVPLALRQCLELVPSFIDQAIDLLVHVQGLRLGMQCSFCSRDLSGSLKAYVTVPSCFVGMKETGRDERGMYVLRTCPEAPSGSSPPFRQHDDNMVGLSCWTSDNLPLFLMLGGSSGGVSTLVSLVRRTSDHTSTVLYRHQRHNCQL